MPTPEELAAAEAAKNTPAQTPEQIAAAEAAKNAGNPPAGDEGKPKADEVGKDGKPVVDDKGKKDEPKAPEKYELKLPDGSLLADGDVARIEALARENNLPNDQAQSMLEATAATMAKQSEDWLAELTADKTYGGAKLEETQRLANAALDKVRPKGTPRGDAFRAMLGRGVGNNLEVMSFLADLGRMTKEDGPIEGQGAGDTTTPKSKAEILYPNSPEFKKK